MRQRTGRPDRQGHAPTPASSATARSTRSPMAVKGCIEGPFSHTTTTGLAHRPDRRRPVPDRVPLAQDVPGQHLQRPARDRHPRHERHRPGPLGHQGQGARAAGLEAAGRRLHEVAAALRQLALRRHAGRDRRSGPAVRRPGLHGRQVRLGPDGQGREDRRRPGARGAQGPRAGPRPDDRRGPRLRRQDGDPAGPGLRGVQPLLVRRAALARRLRGLRQALRRVTACGSRPARRRASGSRSSSSWTWARSTSSRST